MSLFLMNTYNNDMKDLNIDVSLNRKIIQNENKLQNLFNIIKNKRENHSTDEKGINKERHLDILRKIKKKNHALNNSTDYHNGYKNKSIGVKKNLSQYFSPKVNNNEYGFDYNNDKSHNKFNVIKVNQKIKKVKNNSKKSSRTNIHSTNNFKNKRKINQKIDSKYKNHLNITARNDNRNKIHYNLNNSNTNTMHKENSTFDYSIKSDRYLSPSVKSLNVVEMMDRFQKDEDKKKEWLENQKKKKEEEEKKVCSHAPKINKVSKKINLKMKDDFFERQKKREEQKKKREEKLREFLNKKKEDEINKNNPLLNKKNKRKNKENNLNTKTISSKTSDKNKKENINNTITKLYEWDQKRKEKIDQKRKKDSEKYEHIDHIPKINKRSASMAEFNKKKYNEKNIFNRLAQKDPVALEKKKLLEELYTPTFTPNINSKRYKTKEEEDDDYSENALSERIEVKSLKPKEMGIKKIPNKNISDEDIQELYRNAIFQNKKKLVRSKSTE